MSRSPGSWQNGGGKKDFFCCIPDVGVKPDSGGDINGWVYFYDSAVFCVSYTHGIFNFLA